MPGIAGHFFGSINPKTINTIIADYLIMAQQNIDFGSFPNDPDADAIRTAFQKTQENFTELYQTQTTSGVVSINNTAQPGITVNSTSGNVLISANFNKLQVSTTTLQVGLSSNTGGFTTVVNSAIQTLFIDLRENISLTGNLTVGNYSVNSVSTGVVGAGNSQVTATPLTKQINVISAGNQNSGVRLPSAVAGMSIIITNTTANNIFIYPASGASINRLTTNAAFMQDTYNTIQFIAVSNIKWYTVGPNN